MMILYITMMGLPKLAKFIENMQNLIKKAVSASLIL